MAQESAAAIVIGNEVLSAKVSDLNGPYLIRRLAEHGVALRSLCVVPDEVDAIVEAVLRARRLAAHVFTSGGVGPTHDDVTVRAVSLALGRPVVRLPALEALIREHLGAGAPPEALRLAEAPEGTELWPCETGRLPVLSCEGLYLLPGVPALFKAQLETVLARLERHTVPLRVLFLGLYESAIAGAVDRVALELPAVAIGSYPTFDRAADYRVKLTVEARTAEEVERALDRLRLELPPGAILREG